LNLSHLDFDIPNMEYTLDVSSYAFLSGDIRISSLCYINSTNSYVRIYKQIMQNKPNFENDKMNITIDTIGIYNILSRWRGQKTKPIQSQFKPNITQNKPNLSQFQCQTKPNKPNSERSASPEQGRRIIKPNFDAPPVSRVVRREKAGYLGRFGR